MKIYKVFFSCLAVMAVCLASFGQSELDKCQKDLMILEQEFSMKENQLKSNNRKELERSRTALRMALRDKESKSEINTAKSNYEDQKKELDLKLEKKMVELKKDLGIKKAELIESCPDLAKALKKEEKAKAKKK